MRDTVFYLFVSQLERFGTESYVVVYAMRRQCRTVSAIFVVASFILRNIKLYTSTMWLQPTIIWSRLPDRVQIDIAKVDINQYLIFHIKVENILILMSVLKSKE